MGATNSFDIKKKISLDTVLINKFKNKDLKMYIIFGKKIFIRRNSLIALEEHKNKMFNAINKCHNVEDLEILLKENFLLQYFIILMETCR